MAAAMAASVSYASDEQHKNLRLVAAYVGVQDRIRLEGGKELSLQNSEGNLHLKGLNTICRYLAELSDRRQQMLGHDDATAAQTSEWLSYRAIGLAPITENKLLQISEHLLTRIFLVHSQPSLADLCLFATLHRAMVSLPPAQIQRYCNLARWFDHIQHTVDTTSVFPKVHISKGAGLPGPPAPPVQTAAKATEKGSKGKEEKPKSEASSSQPSQQQGNQSAQQKGRSPGPAASTSVASAATAEPIRPQKAANQEADSSQKDAKEAKKAARKEARKEAEPKKAEEASIDMLDIRVGQIIEVGAHPSADTLYVEQIDVGEGKPRQVVSGLRKHVPEEQMRSRRVVVCTNLKPAKMRDVISYGMVLCASKDEKVIPLLPPKSASLGDSISVQGFSSDPLAEVNPKKKILEKLKPDMQTDASGNATYKGVLFTVRDMPITSGLPQGSVG